MSISEKLTRLSDARDDTILALSEKSVDAEGHGFEDFPDDIRSIIQGSGSAVIVTDTEDIHGGTIREITAVSLDGITVRPNVLLQGYTAINSSGQLITGEYAGGSTITLQTKSVTPTTVSQTITPDTGYDGLSQVTVAAIPYPDGDLLQYGSTT